MLVFCYFSLLSVFLKGGAFMLTQQMGRCSLTLGFAFRCLF
uniref:Uncharacterized protein n=1 Tax=Anguilla anguilla TaxID=7936 RepID=A0A0E9WDI7_ANGAN